jgi:hypothetical protein
MDIKDCRVTQATVIIWLFDLFSVKFSVSRLAKSIERFQHPKVSMKYKNEMLCKTLSKVLFSQAICKYITNRIEIGRNVSHKTNNYSISKK